jgi:hypothetical protein
MEFDRVLIGRPARVAISKIILLSSVSFRTLTEEDFDSHFSFAF